MTKHKWHDEIVAWAGGTEIQYKNKFDPDDTWDTEVEMEPEWNNKVWEFRIKPQPKEKKYLYVYRGHKGETIIDEGTFTGYECIGKIEVLDD